MRCRRVRGRILLSNSIVDFVQNTETINELTTTNQDLPFFEENQLDPITVNFRPWQTTCRGVTFLGLSLNAIENFHVLLENQELCSLCNNH